MLSTACQTRARLLKLERGRRLLSTLFVLSVLACGGTLETPGPADGAGADRAPLDTRLPGLPETGARPRGANLDRGISTDTLSDALFSDPGGLESGAPGTDAAGVPKDAGAGPRDANSEGGARELDGGVDAAPKPDSGPPPRPNFIIIVADDLGYGDLSSYGGPIAASQLDTLASQGIRFREFHVSPMCTPTRVALATGRYPQRSGLVSALPADSTTGISGAEVTLAEMLRDAGYSTALVGKWHLGKQDPFSPTRHGFQTFYGMRGGAADHLTHRNVNNWLDWWRNETPNDVREYSATAVTREALSFLDSHSDKPFFLQVAYQQPHTPYQGPNDPPGYNNVASFPAMVRAVDQGIGEIIARVRRLQLERRTLVLFFSDNGGHPPGSSNAPLRGGKTSVFEGGIRVPAIAWWPGTITPRVSDDLVAVQDLLPTLAEIAGATLPPVTIDGRSIAPVLKSGGPAPARRLFWKHGNNAAVRDGQWKLVMVGGEPMLFNLSADLSENVNLAARRPAQVTELRAAITTWLASVTP